MACGVLRAPDTVIEALDSLGGKPAAQLQLVVDVWEARGRLWTKGRSAKLKRIADALTPELQEIVAALGFRRRAAKGVNASALDRILAAAGSLPARTLKLLVPIIVASGGDPTEALRRWLLIADDKDDALKATEAAIATGSIPLIELGLRHKRADARRAALVALARAKADPLSDELLRLAHDPGSRVRRALVAMLKDRPHPLHLPVLLELIHDTWSDTDAYYNEPESYPIAREAIEALAQYDDLPGDLGPKLLNLADQTPDRRLSQFALILAAHSFGPEIRIRIWSMVLMPVSRWIRLDALEALAEAAVIEPDIVAQITPTLLLRLPAVLAVPATVLLCSHAPPEESVRILERVASSNNRRALLLTGAVTLAPSAPDQAVKLLDLLEPTHPARALLTSTVPLPVTVLDDLGKVRLRRAVREHLGDRLADVPVT